MGMFNFFKKKDVKKTSDNAHHSEMEQYKQQSHASVSYISKESIERAIKTMMKMADIYQDSQSLKASGGGRNDKMVNTMYSYAGILGYMYEMTYKYGEYSNIAREEMMVRYVLVSSAMEDENARKKVIEQLAYNWSDVLVTVVSIQKDKTPQSQQLLNLQPEIDFTTKVIEVISGSKCKNPQEGFSALEERELNKNKYALMVETASFNPFNITNNPSLQNNPPLPDFFYETFKKELTDIFHNPETRGMNPKDIFRGYVFNLVESYYNNAGYVPKTTVDAIINDCYKAVQQTKCCSTLGTLDEVYYWVYYGFLNE